MATVDDLIVQIKQYFNRPQWFDGSGADVTATVLPLFVNQAVHILERNLVTPFQTFSYQLTLAPNVQQYLLIPSGTPAVSYRSTRGITIPFQSGLASGIGARVFLQPHVQAREKWQLQKQVTANLQNTGPPVDYSVYWAPTLTPSRRSSRPATALPPCLCASSSSTPTVRHRSLVTTRSIRCICSWRSCTAMRGPRRRRCRRRV